jgi:hypothetical protein
MALFVQRAISVVGGAAGAHALCPTGFTYPGLDAGDGTVPGRTGKLALPMSPPR